MAKKIDIKKIFSGLQQQMEARLSLNREIIKHPTTKGDASELEWIEMLSKYLPKRYEVDKAFVVDCEGNISEQIDLVIFDRHFSPFILHQNGAKYIPAEAVYAVIEIKQEITNQNLEYASKKIKSVRKLERTSGKIIQAGGNVDKPRKPFNILGGILALDGKCTTNTINKLKSFSQKGCINFGCSLSGTFFNLCNVNPWADSIQTYDYKIVNESSNSLVLFFLNLVAELRNLGTVPAIEIDKYIDKIK